MICFLSHVRYYNSTIIRMTGVESDIVILWLAPIVLSSAFIGSLITCLFLITKVGRRTLALGSLAGMLVFFYLYAPFLPHVWK